MDSIIALLFGLVQGLTEFLPVSSSGHLVILHRFLPPLPIDELTFDVALHAGTLLALLLYFWQDIVQVLRAWVESIGRKLGAIKTVSSSQADQRLAWLLVLSIIPAGVAGVLFEDIIEFWLRSLWVVVIMLIVVAVVFIVLERQTKWKFDRELSQLRWPHAFLIGFAQALALIPGTSRSGITIVAGMVSGLRRDQAARFSFLSAIPLVAGAALKKGLDLLETGLTADAALIFCVGMLAAAVSGYLVIRWLLQYLSTHGLIPFAIYRLVLAAVIVIMLFI